MLKRHLAVLTAVLVIVDVGPDSLQLSSRRAAQVTVPPRTALRPTARPVDVRDLAERTLNWAAISLEMGRNLRRGRHSATGLGWETWAERHDSKRMGNLEPDATEPLQNR